MSSLRNAVSRRPHKERSQPQSRDRLGILEKHKDYSLRAQDYNTKKKKLSQLSRKAKERNPDEFAFGMVNQGRAGLGKHKSKAGDQDNSNSKNKHEIVPGQPLSHDAVKLLKTQDAGYLRTVAATGRKAIERLTEEVGMDSVTVGKKVMVGKKTTFREDETENDESLPLPRGKKRTSNGDLVISDQPQPQPLSDKDITFLQAVEPTSTTTTTIVQPGVADDDDLDVIESRKPKSKKALQAQQDALSRLKAERKKRQRLQELRVGKLEALKKRQREILAAADQLELQRAKMAHTIGGVNKNGVKFKIRERKR